jgi:hypothetical protein
MEHPAFMEATGELMQEAGGAQGRFWRKAADNWMKNATMMLPRKDI